jgi:hypothetical protein
MGDPLVPKHLPEIAAKAIRRNWNERQTAQNQLRDVIATWAGFWKFAHHETDREIHKRFFLTFDTDILTAQSLNAADAEALRAKVLDTIPTVSNS